MSDFYLGQIMMTGFGFAPKYWAQCNGQLMAISQNAALFSLLGTNYGGDGIRTFALPDLRSRTPAGGGFSSTDPNWTSSYLLGQVGGTETVTLMTSEMAMHTHSESGTTAAGAEAYGSNTTGFATISPDTGLLYGQMASQVPLNSATLGLSGGNQPHNNIQPFETINFNCSLAGIYPSRN